MPTWKHLPTAKRAASRRQGIAAQSAGASWEEALNLYHAHLLAQGLAAVHKTGPTVKWVAQGDARVVAPGPCDYIGVLHGGQAVNFEAKTSSNAQGFTLPADSMHQLDWLRTVVGLGGLAFYLVFWSATGETRVHFCGTIDGRRLRRVDGLLINGLDWYNALKGDN